MQMNRSPLLEEEQSPELTAAALVTSSGLAIGR
jgi:hypothetical protein